MSRGIRNLPTIVPAPPRETQPGTCRRCRLAITHADGRPNLRRTWHQECADAHRWETMPAVARQAVRKRDHGVCELCALDTVGLARTLVARCEFERLPRSYYIPVWLEALGWGRVVWPRDLWEMDHRTPLHLGGQHVLENLRTLCIACHKGKTKAEARARADARKAAS